MWARQRRLLGLFFRNLLSRLLRLLPFRHLLRQLLTEDLNRLWPNTITPDPNKNSAAGAHWQSWGQLWAGPNTALLLTSGPVLQPWGQPRGSVIAAPPMIVDPLLQPWGCPVDPTWAMLWPEANSSLHVGHCHDQPFGPCDPLPCHDLSRGAQGPGTPEPVPRCVSLTAHAGGWLAKKGDGLEIQEDKVFCAHDGVKKRQAAVGVDVRRLLWPQLLRKIGGPWCHPYPETSHGSRHDPRPYPFCRPCCHSEVPESDGPWLMSRTEGLMGSVEAVAQQIPCQKP
ncbi:MAG: hypothetical protein FRX49_05307 [Trebouxia sp. A1-2]|nr:MAG: hypothetical protein FRX49_05307 [Trebouxia sp. A1-2]